MQTNEIEDTLPLGLLSWYSWKKESYILCIGANAKAFADFLREKGLEAVTGPTGDKENQYDYIIALSVLEREKDPVQVLSQWKKWLKPEGHLFIAMENRLGLRYFCGDQDPFTHRNLDGLNGYRDYSGKEQREFGGRNYAKFEMEQMLSAAGLTNRKFYSVLPGLEMPQQIYAEDYLPEEELGIRYTPLYHSKDTIFMEEGYLYTSLIRNGMFHQMANAYLIDCTLQGTMQDIKHITVSMDRGAENALATIIYGDGKVCKRAIYQAGKKRLEDLMRNTNRLQAQGIHVVQAELTEDGFWMPYVKAETALKYLRRLAHKDKEKFILEVDRFRDCIMKSSKQSDKEPADPDMGTYLEYAYPDMVPLNCFYQNGEFVFFDQEFCEENYPANIILMRALDILYMNDKQMEGIVPIQFFVKRYGLEKKLSTFRNKGSVYIKKLRKHEELAEYNRKHLADITIVNTNRQRMNYANQDYLDTFVHLLKDTEGKKVFIFGAGMWARKFIAWFGDSCHIEAALDNNEEHWGEIVDGIPVRSPEVLKAYQPGEYKVIICIKRYAAVLRQLEQYGTVNYGIYDPYIEYQSPVADRRNAISDRRPERENDEKSAQDTNHKKYQVGYIAGVFDLFHVGHLNMLRRAKEQCEYLLVGVVSDEGVIRNKNVEPFIPCTERLEIVRSCKYVDEAFELPFASAGTRDVFQKYHFDVQFSGSDYEHDPGWLETQAYLREHGADLVFFPYTQATSSTKIKSLIRERLI